jgi:acetate kinase
LALARRTIQRTVTILCLDAGSSSLKFAVYGADDAAERRLLRGAAENLNQGRSKFWIEDAAGRRQEAELPSDSSDPAGVLEHIVEACGVAGLDAPSAVGHRIVFGGPDHTAPAVVDAQLLSDLERFLPFDRLHLRMQLDLVMAVASRFPASPQVLCFDTAFHHRMPKVARRIPLPRSIGPLVRRYGYHGLSYEYIVDALGENAAGRTVIAHLGSGASLAAVRDAKPVDTTMGFSPLGGLMMSTRPGDLDPGILLYLVTVGNTASDLERLLTERSGLLGVSEVSSSMETLLGLAAENECARDAVELFVYQLCKHIGAMIVVLGGLDTLVFTGGIGEHAGQVRKLVVDRLGHLGLALDMAANARNADVISSEQSAVTVRVIATDEAAIIAAHVRKALCDPRTEK